ncbi:MAG: AhpC/TSA family protein [Bacteroidales bacterium]|nr:AhpC/TSA family protein [Bacteroidales bacterium]
MRNLFLILIAGILAFSCSKPKNQFEIKANLEGVSEGWVILAKAVDNDLSPLDSLMVKEGKFSFKGTIDIPEMYYLHFKTDEQYLGFFVEPGELNITGTLQEAKYEGLPTQALYDRLVSELKVYENQFEEISLQYREAAARNDEMTQRAIEQRATVIEKERMDYMLNFAEANNTSIVAPFILVNNIQNFDIEKVESSMAKLDPSVHGSNYYVMLNEQVEKLQRLSVGREAPVFSQNDPDGNPISLDSFRGKYLLVDFWASWCKPCRIENPNIVAAYAKYHDKGFEVFGVSLDRDKNAWLKGIADDNLTWPQVSDLQYWNNEASKLYSISSIPANLLLDPEGIIIAKNLRGEELHTKLAELLD